MANRTSTRGDTGRRRVSQVHVKKSGAGRPKPSARRRAPSKGGASSKGRAPSKGRGRAAGNGRRGAPAGKASSKKKQTASKKTASKKTASSKGRSDKSRRASGRPSRPQPKQSLLTRLYELIRFGIGRQTPDVIGLILVGSGLLVALAFFQSSGPIGRWALSGFRFLVGMWVYVLPAVLLALGGALLLGRCRNEYRRVMVGTSLGFLGSLSLFHLFTGNAPFAGDFERVRQTGGALGALTAFPLDRLLGFWGAFLLLAVVTAAGVMIVMRASVSEVLGAAGAILSLSVSRMKAGWTALRAPRPAPDRGRRHPAPEHRPPHPSEAARVPPPPPVTTEAPPADSPSEAPANGGKPTKSGKKQAVARIPVPPGGDGYVLPPLDLLEAGGGEGQSRRMLEETARQLESALHHHNVDARLTNVVPGPTVTRYEIELAPGVKVSRVTNLTGDIAYALATPDIRLLAPIPGRSAIGVEVPNRVRRLVTLGDVLSSPEAAGSETPLAVGLGEDISGRPEMLNLEQLPHVLIAGATGAGKSSCINSIVTSLLMRTRPEDVRLIMVDPKRVELGQYNGVPHLLTRVITNPKKAVEALQWAVAEMERRYELLADGGVRDITGYQDKFDAGRFTEDRFDRFPYLVVLIDELNDLMMVAGRDVESAVVRLAQMARAVGIHLVIATQRPSVNVITGVIKANIPSRLAFSVASQTDSRVIIDTIGADKLVGMGDMLVVTAREPQARRVQGAWVSEDEVSAVVNWVKAQKEAEYREIAEEVAVERAAAAEADDDEDADLIRRATELVVRSQLGSTSMLQRKLRVGFARAGRLMDILEQRGVVGPSVGSKAREVLITIEELESRSAAPV